MKKGFKRNPKPKNSFLPIRAKGEGMARFLASCCATKRMPLLVGRRAFGASTAEVAVPPSALLPSGAGEDEKQRKMVEELEKEGRRMELDLEWLRSIGSSMIESAAAETKYQTLRSTPNFELQELKLEIARNHDKLNFLY